MPWKCFCDSARRRETRIQEMMTRAMELQAHKLEPNGSNRHTDGKYGYALHIHSAGAIVWQSFGSTP